MRLTAMAEVMKRESLREANEDDAGENLALSKTQAAKRRIANACR